VDGLDSKMRAMNGVWVLQMCKGKAGSECICRKMLCDRYSGLGIGGEWELY
jgi:hypothetical protein